MFSLLAICVWVLQASDPSFELCDDHLSECKETCSMEFGTDENARFKLGQCLLDCKTELRECRSLVLAGAVKIPDAGTKDVEPATATSRPTVRPPLHKK